MEAGIIVMLGEMAPQPSWLDRLVKSAGWQYQAVASLNDLRELADSNIAAVFFNARSLELPLKDCLVWIQSITPAARCVVCHGFLEEIDWASLSNWGAFHSLPLPLDPAELRQALGFIAMDRREQSPMIPELPKSVGEFA